MLIFYQLFGPIVTDSAQRRDLLPVFGTGHPTPVFMQIQEGELALARLNGLACNRDQVQRLETLTSEW
jgi:hypothetical protein